MKYFWFFFSVCILRCLQVCYDIPWNPNYLWFMGLALSMLASEQFLLSSLPVFLIYLWLYLTHHWNQLLDPFWKSHTFPPWKSICNSKFFAKNIKSNFCSYEDGRLVAFTICAWRLNRVFTIPAICCWWFSFRFSLNLLSSLWIYPCVYWAWYIGSSLRNNLMTSMLFYLFQRILIFLLLGSWGPRTVRPSESNVRGCNFLSHWDEIKQKCIPFVSSTHTNKDQNFLLPSSQGWYIMFY